MHAAMCSFAIQSELLVIFGQFLYLGRCSKKKFDLNMIIKIQKKWEKICDEVSGDNFPRKFFANFPSQICFATNYFHNIS